MELNISTGSSKESFSPLLDPKGNALSPNFVALAALCLGIGTFMVGGFQLIQLMQLPSHGPMISSRYHDVLKRNLVISHIILLSILLIKIAKAYGADFIIAGYGTLLMALSFIIFPLHLIEKSKNYVQTATLLLFWPLEFIFFLIISFQQLLGNEEQCLLPLSKKWDFFLLGMILLTNIMLYYLEFNYYKPNPELLDNIEKDGKIHLKTPNIISRMTFRWMNPLIELAHSNNGLDQDDLPAAPEAVSTSHSAPILARNWEDQMKLSEEKRSLFYALAKTFAGATSVCIFYDMSESIISFVQPQLLKRLIKFFATQDEEPPVIIGFTIAFSMFIVSIITTMVFNQAIIKSVEAKLSAKAALRQLIYKKAMILAPSERVNKSTGDIMNNISIDINTVVNLLDSVETMLSAPTRFVLCLASLYGLLGNATWVGILTMAIMMPLNTLLVKKLRKLHREQMQLKDKRTSFVSEILQNVKSIKLYAWEAPMLEKLSHLRNDKELANLKKIGVLSAGINFAWTCVPFFVSCSTFAVFAIFSGISLTPEIVFPALSLFDLLSDPIFALPAMITALIQCSVSMKRLSSFMNSEEVNPITVTRLPKVTNFGDVSVSVSNCTFLWRQQVDKNACLGDHEEAIDDSRTEALVDINFKAKKGQLSCIVGRVGSGKSTFLSSILGEMPVVAADKTKSFDIRISGNIAYCSQLPWIINATFKDNILFGHKYEASFYEKTIQVCQLQPDLEILPDGDETLVGEKGISLSGGQKARLSLARAIYARADIYIFDDVLSAVDAHVGENLINQVLGHKGILQSKTRILATNSIKVLKESSEIYLLENKKIVEFGTFNSIMKKMSGKLYEVIQEFGNTDSNRASETDKSEIGFGNNFSDSGESVKSEDVIESCEMKDPQVESTFDETTDAELTKFSSKVRRKLSENSLNRASLASFKRLVLADGLKRKTAFQVEKKAVGKVKLSVFKRYAEACSYFGIGVTLGLVVLTVGLSIGSSYWLMFWSNNNVENGKNEHILFYVGIYALLGIGSGFTTLIRAVCMWTLCSIKASTTIHSDMAYAVLSSPLSFFETTPLGRIINRFSQDMNVIDGALPKIFAALFASIVKTFFTLGVICFNMPLFVVVIILLSFAYSYFQRYYVTIIRDLKRITSITRSPIFAHIQESLNGAETVRAYEQSKRFLFISDLNIDTNQVTQYCLASLNRWLAARLQFIGSVIVLSTSLMAISSLWTSSPIGAGLLGLIMSYALRVTSSLTFIVRRSVEVESDAVCCERIFEYCELPPERDEKNDATLIEPALGWPHKGELVFDDYTTRYRENLDPVLRNISLSIAAGEKIGIVGRTGAGKSSLVLSIFRIIEPLGGSIAIDGVDTTTLRLNDLRRNLSIIPQDAQCIEGSIKYNLDPFNQYREDQIWHAIRMAKLEEQVIKMGQDQEKANALDSAVSESGLNLSVGQRQLVCLARVLLRAQQSMDLTLEPSKILVLDEATSSVDAETDKIIQETIRSQFGAMTILTIAHRLETIMDNNKILVLEKGQVAEFDTPDNLLANKSSKFYSLCVDSGHIGNTSATTS